MGELWFISRGQGESRGEGMVGLPSSWQLLLWWSWFAKAPFVLSREMGSKRKLEEFGSLGEQWTGGGAAREACPQILHGSSKTVITPHKPQVLSLTPLAEVLSSLLPLPPGKTRAECPLLPSSASPFFQTDLLRGQSL